MLILLVHRTLESVSWCFYVIYRLSPARFQETWSVHEAGNKDMLSPNVAFLFSCFVGSFRNDGLKAADVLPILKEKVAFVSGEHIFAGSLQPNMSTICHVLVLMVLQSHKGTVSFMFGLGILKLALLLRRGLYVEQGYPVRLTVLETSPC